MLSATLRRWLFWSPVILALTFGLVWLLRPKPVLVDFATVARGPLQVTVSDEGETRVKDVFRVSAPLGGFMYRLDLEAGDTVTARKTVVARIAPNDPTLLDPRSQAEAHAAVHAAEAGQQLAAATLKRAQTELDYADHELQRVRGLRARESVSLAELDAAEQRSRAAAASMAEARAGLRVRESELDQARDGEHWAVFVNTNNRASRRHLTLGAENGIEAEVLDGLKVGEQVVLHPSDRVRTGARLADRSQ